jgi:hypothetical protein
MSDKSNEEISYLKTIVSTGIGLAVFGLLAGFLILGLEYLLKKLWVIIKIIWYWIFPQYKPQEMLIMESNKELIEYAKQSIINGLPPDLFAKFYVNWVGMNHIITVLNNAIEHGDMNVHILETCKTKDDVDVFIRTTIWGDANNK